MPELKSNPRPPKGPGPSRSIEDWLGDPYFKTSVEAILPRHLTSERFISIALRCFRQTPKLLECTPASVLAGLIDSAQLGLEIGLGGECWLLPYNIRQTMTAQLTIGYLGHLSLAWRSGLLAAVEANVVTHDEVKAGRFSYQHGTDGFLHHTPEADRELTEQTIAYGYALVWPKGSDRPIWRVLDSRQIRRLRNTGASANSPAWTNWFDEQVMAKALKRTLKWAPKSREVAHAVSIDDEADAGVSQTYQSGVDVAGLLNASAPRPPETAEMEREMARRNQEPQPGVGEPAEPDQEGAGLGTVPPPPQREREPVLAQRRRPSGGGENPGSLGF